MAEAYQTALFLPARNFLLQYHEEREAVIRLCRDITAYSKKMIFMFHRVDANQSQIYDQTFEHIKIIAARLATIHREYSGSVNFCRYKSSISNATEEMIEAMTFMYFITTGELLTYRQFMDAIEVLVEGGMKDDDEVVKRALEMLINKREESNVQKLKEKEKDDDKNDQNKEQEDDTSTSNSDPSVSMTSNNPYHIPFIYEGDYFMGLFDLSGEIMRYTISNLKEGQRAQLLSMLDFMQILYKEVKSLFYMYPDLNIYQGIFSTDFSKGCMSIRKKMDVFKNSLDKVEQTVCEFLIRGEEMGPIDPWNASSEIP